MTDDTALPSDSHRDFFISRAGKDAAFAIWLGQLIAAQGKTYILQDEHFGHQSFMGAMDAALTSSARVVGLLTQPYLESDYCVAEASAALKGDPLNRQQRLILLRVEPCAPGGVLANIAYTSLLAERREPDALPLALRILHALGFADPHLEGLPPPPDGTLTKTLQLLHPDVRAAPGFAGRTEELAALEVALWREGGGTAAAVAAKGLGGVGKSALAREYAWRHRGRYQGVWWLRAERPETLHDDLIDLGARYIPGLKEVPERDKAARQTLAWLEQAGFDPPWLLVYDNVVEPGDLRGLTPHTGAHVLITTRWSDWDQAAAPVEVGVLPADVATQFLLDATGRTDRAGAKGLALALGHLPLALDHAAAYCRRTGTGFSDYERLAAELLHKEVRGVDYETPVLATFSLAIEKAAETCPKAEMLLGLAAFLAPNRIPLSLFTTDLLSEVERGEAVAALTEVSLLVPDPLDDASPGIAVHRLVQAAMRGRLTEMGELSNAAALATELVADAYPSGDPGPDDVRAWPACACLTPHALAVFEHAPDSGNGADKTSLLLHQTALNYVSRAAYAEAEPLMRRHVEIFEKFERDTGHRHPRYEVAVGNLAALEAQMRAAAARPPAEPLRGVRPSGSDTIAPEAEMVSETPKRPTVAEKPNAPMVSGKTGKATFLNWMFGRQ